MKLYILLLIFLFAIFLFPEIFIANGNMKPIHAGDNIYIYGTSGIMSFSLDIPDSLLEFKKINNYSDRIYIGKIKDNIPIGFSDSIMLNTNEQTIKLPIVITPRMLRMDLMRYNYIFNDTLSGSIVFGDNNRTSGNSIDSLILFIYSNSDSLRTMIFKDDSLLDYDYSNGFFMFNIPLQLKNGDYSVNCIYYSNNLLDTVFDIRGFSIGRFDSDYSNIIIIDTDTKSENDTFIEKYFDMNNNMCIYSVYYRGYNLSSIDMDNFSNIYIFTDRGLLFHKNKSFFYNLFRSKNNKYIFFKYFNRIFDCFDNGEIDSFFNILNIDKSQNDNYSDIKFLIEKGQNTGYSVIYDNENSINQNYIFRDNMLVFLYLPAYSDMELLNHIFNNLKNLNEKEMLGEYITIEKIYNENYNKYTIELFDIKGKYINSIDIGALFQGENILNINSLLKYSDEIKKGLYFYKIYRGEECIKFGRVFVSQ